MKKLLVMLLVVVMTCAMVGALAETKIGVSIMELTAYTWYQGVIDGCNQWAADNAEEYGVNLEFDFEDSRSDVQTMLTNLENMRAAGSNGIILFSIRDFRSRHGFSAGDPVFRSGWIVRYYVNSVFFKFAHFNTYQKKKNHQKYNIILLCVCKLCGKILIGFTLEAECEETH